MRGGLLSMHALTVNFFTPSTQSRADLPVQRLALKKQLYPFLGSGEFWEMFRAARKARCSVRWWHAFLIFEHESDIRIVVKGNVISRAILIGTILYIIMVELISLDRRKNLRTSVYPLRVSLFEYFSKYLFYIRVIVACLWREYIAMRIQQIFHVWLWLSSICLSKFEWSE